MEPGFTDSTEEINLLQWVLNGISEGVIALDAQGRYVFVNVAAARMLGYDTPQKVQQLDLATLASRYEMFDELGRPMELEHLPTRDALRGRIVPPSLVRWRPRSSSGEYRWSMVRANPLFDADGRVALVVTIWHDVTEQKQQEKWLAIQNAVLAAQAEASPDGILVVMPPGQILSCNRRFREMWGLDDGAIERGSDLEAIERVLPLVTDPEGFTRRIQELYEHPDESAIDEIRLKDGRIFERHTAPLRSPEGQWLGRIWFFRDVTDARRAFERERLLEVERATRAALVRGQRSAAFLADASRILSRSLDVGSLLAALADLTAAHFRAWVLIDLIKPGGVVHRVAAAPSREFEWVARELERRAPGNGNVLEGRFVDDEPEMVQGMPGLLQAGIRQVPWLLSSWDDDAVKMLERLRLESWLAVPIRRPGGRAGVLTLAWGAAHEPITPEVKNLLEDLASRIGLAVENATLYENVSQAVVAREEFLSIASHELRTPIATLQLLVQSIFMASAKEEQPIPKWLAPRLKAIERQARRLGVLVTRLLDVTRLMTGRLELVPQHMDLVEAARETIEMFEEERVASGSTITLDAPEPVWGNWDRSRIEQLVTNLISNAIKYGSGRPILVRVWRDERDASIEIRDEGIGITPEAQERIFEPFERAVASRHISGFGLGLYVVRQVVEAMGGRIDVQSVAGKGSAFRITLPLEPVH